MENNNCLLDIQNLSVVFKMRQGLTTAVNGVSLQVPRGKIVGLVGESGSGKSVMARSILRIESPGKITGGSIQFNSPTHGLVNMNDLNPEGNTIRSIRWKEIAMVFQEPMTSFGPMHTFGNQISEALILHEKLSKKEALERAIEGLRLVGMPRPEKLVTQYPHQISGGMRQRAMIAMALICNPSILIADEPTTALDVSTESQILQMLLERQAKMNTSILYISHNLGVVSNIADEVVVMYLGQIIEKAQVNELFTSPKHPYSEALINAVPKVDLDYQSKKLNTLKGSIPDPYSHPKGCKFHPRCPKFMQGICDTIVPPYIEVEAGRHVACHLYKPIINT
jgi:peptide/nickel transport system ATP-binding protein